MDDHEILMALREAPPTAGPDADKPPAQVIEAAFAAGVWACLDYELAVLVADSADSAATAGVRADPSDLRQLTYSVNDLTIECELGSGALLGQVVPASGLQLELITPDGGSRQLEVDAEGRFLLRPQPTGPVGIRCTGAGRQTVLTPWLLA